MAFPTKDGKHSFTNPAAARRHDRMAEQPAHAPAESPKSGHKAVTVVHDGSQFHVEGKAHADIESALNHARAIFGGHSGSEDTAFEAAEGM